MFLLGSVFDDFFRFAHILYFLQAPLVRPYPISCLQRQPILYRRESINYRTILKMNSIQKTIRPRPQIPMMTRRPWLPVLPTTIVSPPLPPPPISTPRQPCWKITAQRPEIMHRPYCCPLVLGLFPVTLGQVLNTQALTKAGKQNDKICRVTRFLYEKKANRGSKSVGFNNSQEMALRAVFATKSHILAASERY